jgi:hypothetical protein
MILGLIVYVIGQRILVEFNQDVVAENEAEAAAHHQQPPHVVRDRIVVLLVVFAFIILFWTAFEQSPNAMLVWADKHTNLNLASTEPPPVVLDETVSPDATDGDDGRSFAQRIGDWFSNPSMSSGQTQSFNPFFIITLAPIFAFLWVFLDRRKLQPSTPAKMALGLVGVVLAFGVMWPAAHFENGASSAPLSALPESILVDNEGRVYTGDPADRTYYGASRLRYEPSTQTLTMTGVLVDLDRFRLLAQTAPDDLAAEVDRFAERVEAEKPGDAGISTQFEHVPTAIGPVEIKEVEGKDRKTILAWDPDTEELTAFAAINERARAEFLARAADPTFKQAVDTVYLESSSFRVSVWWLIGFYLLLTMGELCLSPVGLSLVTKLAPPKHVGLFMGGWFLATAVAEKLAQVFGAYWGKMPPGDYFLIFVIMCAVGALLMGVLVPVLKRMMHGVQ